MLELSMHVLDIVENSIRAGAKKVFITIEEDTEADTLVLSIIDDGEGMDPETLKKVFDPFYTTKSVRRIGLGLPMLAHAARSTGGYATIESAKECGTTTKAVFIHSHIDRQPLGNMADTIVTLIAGNTELDFVYTHLYNGRAFEFDTRQLRKSLDFAPLCTPMILHYIRSHTHDGLKEIGSSVKD